MAYQTADITWQDGLIPVSTRFDDPYYSRVDGLAETRHAFLKGNELARRIGAGFHIAELGFGAGLNMLAAWQLWLNAGFTSPLRYTAFEAYPMRSADLRTALEAFPELSPLASQLYASWTPDTRTLTLPGLNATIIHGDARQTLGRWSDAADAWFLDGFSPAKNPEMWGAELLRQVGQSTATTGTVATYSAAGHVRQSLDAAGFDVQRVPGYGRKRHMTIGRKRPT